MSFSLRPISTFDDDLFELRPLISRIVGRVLEKGNDSTLTGIFGRPGMGRSSALNLCRSLVQDDTELSAQCCWLKSFEAWRIESIGNLPAALLWHIHRSLPDAAGRDEKVLYKLGRLSVALSVVGYNVGGKISGPGSPAADLSKGLEIVNKVLPPEKKSPVSAVFSACEQIEDIIETFSLLGQTLCENLGCSRIVVPIDDLDRCCPESAISLLFTLKNLMGSRYFSFLLAHDKNTLVRSLNAAYGNIFSESDARVFIERIFDDWVDIPPPPFGRILAGIEFPDLPGANREQFLSDAEACSIGSIAGTAAALVRACRRFESFLRDLARTDMQKRSGADFLAWFGWCALGAGNPEQLKAFANSRNLIGTQNGFEQVIAACREFTKSGKANTLRKEKAAISKIRLTGENTRAAPAFPEPLRDYVADQESALMRFMESTQKRLTERQLSLRLIEILPFV